jgi:hypothetical protein
MRPVALRRARWGALSDPTLVISLLMRTTSKPG